MIGKHYNTDGKFNRSQWLTQYSAFPLHPGKQRNEWFAHDFISNCIIFVLIYFCTVDYFLIQIFSSEALHLFSKKMPLAGTYDKIWRDWQRERFVLNCKYGARKIFYRMFNRASWKQTVSRIIWRKEGVSRCLVVGVFCGMNMQLPLISFLADKCPCSPEQQTKGVKGLVDSGACTIARIK